MITRYLYLYMRTSMLLIFFLPSLVVNGQKISDYLYVRPMFDFDANKSIFSFTKEQVANENRYLRYYALTGYREGVSTTSGPFGVSFSTFDNGNSGTRLLYMYNVSIEEMVTHRLGESDRVIYQVKDPSRYRYLRSYGSKLQWMRKNALCFELLLPKSSMNIEVVDTLLSKTLGILWQRQKRSVTALILSRLSKKGKIKFQYKRNDDELDQEFFKKVTFDVLGSALAVDGRPFLNETGYEGLVDLNLKLADLKDLTTINDKLERYDLVLREEIRELDMLVITEKKFKDKQ